MIQADPGRRSPSCAWRATRLLALIGVGLWCTAYSPRATAALTKQQKAAVTAAINMLLLTPTPQFGAAASGNQLVSTLSGAPITLIGSVGSGCEMIQDQPDRCNLWAAEPTSWWQTTWTAQSPGFNTVRLHLNSQMWLGGSAMTGTTSYPAVNDSYPAGSYTCTGFSDGTGSAYQTDIQTIVNNATAAGVYVILDLESDAPPGYCAIGEPGFLSTYATTFWQQVATVFMNNPAVIFDIFNEPWGQNDYCNGFGASNCGDVTNPNSGAESTTMVQGGTVASFWIQNNFTVNDMTNVSVNPGGSYTSVGQGQLLSTIRGTGATNLILGSIWWFAGEIELWPQAWSIASANPDPQRNFAASMHAYGYDGPSYPGGPDPNSGNTTALTTLLSDGYPLLITEFISNEGSGLGDSIGYLATGSNMLSLGVSGLIGCCTNTWNNSSVSIGPGTNGW